MKPLPNRPTIMEEGNLRLPITIKNHNTNLNAWHEKNALFTPIWNALVYIKTLGIDQFEKECFYDPNKQLTLVHKMKNTNCRAGGLEYLYDHYLKNVIEKKLIKNVLDIGCGQGEMSLWFSTAGVQYTGIDIALSNIGFCVGLLACFKFLKKDSPQPKFLQMFGENLRFKDKTFDLVFTSHVLEHFHNLDKAFGQMCRVGKSICGVVARPNVGDESDEHMRTFEKGDIEKYLEQYCSSHTIEYLNREIVFWGEVKK